MTPALLVRADAMPGMGSGHIMRCRALIAAARKAGLSVLPGGRCGIDWLRPLLEQEQYVFFEGNCPEQESPGVLLAQLEHMAKKLSRPLETCAAVLDGYHFTVACQTAVRATVRALLVVDDDHHLPSYACDILVNQNPGAEAYSYRGDIRSVLLGPRYALLRPEFYNPPPVSAQAADILLSLGGGDFSCRLPSLASELLIPQMQGKRLRILAGGMPPHAVQKVFEKTPLHFTVVHRVDDMPALLADTALCITAGGSTCLELCRMGVPFLTVEIAQNQHRICEWLERHAYAPRLTAAGLATFLTDASLRQERALQLRQLVDGKGAERVIRGLRTFLATEQSLQQ